MLPGLISLEAKRFLLFNHFRQQVQQVFNIKMQNPMAIGYLHVLQSGSRPILATCATAVEGKGTTATLMPQRLLHMPRIPAYYNSMLSIPTTHAVLLTSGAWCSDCDYYCYSKFDNGRDCHRKHLAFDGTHITNKYTSKLGKGPRLLLVWACLDTCVLVMVGCLISEELSCEVLQVIRP